MRKIFIVALLLLSAQGFSLYNGNPSLPMMPEVGAFIPRDVWFGIKGGYEFDFVYDRKLHMEGQHLKHYKKSVHTFESVSNFGVFTLNFNDRVEVFTTLGSMSFDICHNPLSQKKISYHTPSHFTWGVGGRAILAYWGDLQVSVNSAYLQSKPTLSSLRVGDKSFSTRHTEFDFTQWQVGFGVSYRLRWFIPYIGADFCDFRTRIDHLRSIEFLIPNEHVTFKESYPVGIFFGFGLSPDRAFNVNFEARFINENAVSASADFKF
jgi:major outer membrane protein